MEAAIIGRDKIKPIRTNWEKVKDDIIRKAVLKKFQTHKEIRNILISTGDEEISEITTDDNYWECGKNKID